MDLFKSQFERIQQQLAALTASQKMLAGALVAVMVLTLMHWGRYAGEAELEPLLARSMTPEEVQQISGQLDTAGIKYKVSGDRILVPAEKQAKIFATLGMSGALPRNTYDGFDEIVKKISAWDGQNRQDKMFNRGKEVFLSQVLENLPEVYSAQVSIDPTSKHRIGATVEPTASVNIKMKPGVKASRKLVEAAARIVSGAQAGLLLKNIQMVANGAYHRVSEEGEGGEYDQDRRQQEEERLSQVVLGLMKDIPGLQVAVSVKIDNQNRTSEDITFDDEKSLHKPISEQSESKEQGGGAAAPVVEPAGSNIAVPAVALPPAPGQGMTSNHEKTDFVLLPAQKKSTVTVKAGAMVPVGASVRVPHSYFVNIANRGKPAAQEPDEAVVEAVIAKEMAKIQTLVARGIHLSGPEVVATAAYYDQLPPVPELVVATASGTVAAVVTTHTKEIALGALALVSLFMASMIVKKSAPAPAVATAGGAVMTAGAGGGMVYGGRVLDAGELLAGEAGEGKPMLDGMELDEDAVRTQQMLDQVATLVDENPDSAASLVRRWMVRS